MSDGFKSRIDQKKTGFMDLQTGQEEKYLNQAQRKEQDEQNRVWNMWDTVKWSHIHVIGIPDRERGK